MTASEVDQATQKVSIFKKFPLVFWVSQIFELMERGAYYTMIPILVIHAQYNVGLTVALAVNLTVFMYPIQYGLPMLSGALGERIGFKKQMIFAFTVLFFAYIFLSFASSPITMILAVMMIGFGIGSYKPLISATVAKATGQIDRNLAYAVYYWTVNLAAAGFPVIFVLLEFVGVLDQSLYAWIFRVGALFFLVNIVFAIFFFREIETEGARTVGEALGNVKTALSDKKFLVMVLLMGGFWALYSSMLNVLPSVLFNFKLVPIWFTAMILGIPNPATIILVGPFLTKFLDKLESLVAVMSGVFFYIVGLFIIGFFGLSLNWTFVIIGIIIASIGEFLVAPGYLSFVSKLATKEKISAYQGANFLANSLGLAGGTLLFGSLYSFIGPVLGRPKFFYGILMTCGLALLIGFMIYYRSWGQDIIRRAKKIRAMEEGVDYVEEIVKAPTGWKRIFGVFKAKGTPFVAAIMIPVVLIGTFSLGSDTFYDPQDEDAEIQEMEPFDVEEFDVANGPTLQESGELDENSEAVFQFSYTPENGESKLKSLSITLTWTDEDDITRLFTTFENQGDTFGLEATYAADPSLNATMNISESSEMVTNSHGSQGTVTLDIEIDHSIMRSDNGTGVWDIVVILGNCGDLEASRPALTYYEDTSNSFQLALTSEEYVPRG